jgi:hypothetical protein
MIQDPKEIHLRMAATTEKAAMMINKVETVAARKVVRKVVHKADQKADHKVEAGKKS